MKILGIQRSARFSPNSVDRDLLILQAVITQTGGDIVSEDDLEAGELAGCSLVLSMARHERTLKMLEEAEKNGLKVMNSARGVRNCNRSVLDRMLREHGFHVPPADDHHGWWLKRGDASAQTEHDVVYCADATELQVALENFRERGIKDIVRQAHVPGDVVKFYGVAPSRFFFTSYPGDTGYSKFGSEKVNGRPHHYRFDAGALQNEAESISKLVETPVYGGDAIITQSGSYFIIDFNDWPSFSSCRDDAARAIAAAAKTLLQE